MNSGLFGWVTNLPMCGDSYYWEFISYGQNDQCLYKNPAYVDCNSTDKWNDKDYLKTDTQWFYGEIDGNGILANPIRINNYNSIKSTGDTIINGIKCHTLTQIKGNAGCVSYDNIVYVYQSNDTVYFLNNNSKKFSQLYVYGANKGDSWTVAYNSQNDKVTVDSTSSIPAFGISLKVQYVTYFTETSDNSYRYGQKSTIIENIGDPNYFFNSNIRNNFICDEFFVNRTGLRCYVHPDLGTYHVPGTLDCSYVTEVSKHNYNALKVSLNSLGILIVEGDFGVESSTLEILDLKGSIILKTSVNVSENTINLSHYNKGLYIYRISTNGTLLKAVKIVKQ